MAEEVKMLEVGLEEVTESREVMVGDLPFSTKLPNYGPDFGKDEVVHPWEQMMFSMVCARPYPVYNRATKAGGRCHLFVQEVLCLGFLLLHCV